MSEVGRETGICRNTQAPHIGHAMSTDDELVLQAVHKLKSVEKLVRWSAGQADGRLAGADTRFGEVYPGTTSTLRTNGKLVPLGERIVRLGERGGLYEIRPSSKAGTQRVSLVKRDQVRCLNNTLRGAKGVCGHIDKVAGVTTKYKHLQRRGDEVCDDCVKEYGSYALKQDVPAHIRRWVTDDQKSQRQNREPAPLVPADVTANR